MRDNTLTLTKTMPYLEGLLDDTVTAILDLEKFRRK